MAVELESGTGLAGQDLCPRCGEAGAVRHLLVASRRRFPNRVWTVRSITAIEGTGDAIPVDPVEPIGSVDPVEPVEPVGPVEPVAAPRPVSRPA